MRLVKPVLDLPWPLYQAEANLLHYPILKNAHSSLSDHLKGRGFGFETYIRGDVPHGAVAFCVLRDPFDRYVSGLAQVWRMGLVADVTWRQFIDGVEAFNKRTATPWVYRDGRRKVDRHFVPQSVTVERMGTPPRTAQEWFDTLGDHPRTVLWRLDELGNMFEWLDREHGLRSDIVLDRQKETSAELRGYAESTLTRGIVERHYAGDMALWNRIAA